MEIYDERMEETEEDTQRGRYLTFTLGENVYGIAIRYVTEIIGIQNVTKVPETPDFIKGIINLRGKIIPLIDVRLKFGKEEIDYSERTCIIVVETGSVQVGLIVDKVDDVLTIEDEQISPPPANRIGFENRYIEGIGRLDDFVLLLLNTEKLLRNDELDAAARLAEREVSIV